MFNFLRAQIDIEHDAAGDPPDVDGTLVEALD
jgi:hypothetical protein